MVNRKRNIRKEIRFSEKEEIKLKKRIEQSMYYNFSDYAREILLNGKIEVRDYTAVRNLKNEMNKIGVNVNQIAKVVNEKRDINQKEFAELKRIFLELSEVVHNICRNEIGMRERRKKRYSKQSN